MKHLISMCREGSLHALDIGSGTRDGDLANFDLCSQLPEVRQTPALF